MEYGTWNVEYEIWKMQLPIHNIAKHRNIPGTRSMKLDLTSILFQTRWNFPGWNTSETSHISHLHSVQIQAVMKEKISGGFRSKVCWRQTALGLNQKTFIQPLFLFWVVCWRFMVLLLQNWQLMAVSSSADITSSITRPSRMAFFEKNWRLWLHLIGERKIVLLRHADIMRSTFRWRPKKSKNQTFLKHEMCLAMRNVC